MREIKFRGMYIKGNWYYGNLSILTRKINYTEAGTYISNSVDLPFAYQVRPETIGQFTGLKDKNGKDIYEGDILKIPGYYIKFSKERKLSKKEAKFWKKNDKESEAEYGRYCIVKWSNIPGGGFTGHGLAFYNEGKIIGNIYENPELLEPPLGNNAEPIRNLPEDDWRKDDR